jgi:hypothetical protein
MFHLRVYIFFVKFYCKLQKKIKRKYRDLVLFASLKHVNLLHITQHPNCMSRPISVTHKMDSSALRALGVVLDERCSLVANELQLAEALTNAQFMNCHTLAYIAAIEKIRKDINPSSVFLFWHEVTDPALGLLPGFIEVDKIESEQVCAFYINKGLKPAVYRTQQVFNLGFDFRVDSSPFRSDK